MKNLYYETDEGILSSVLGFALNTLEWTPRANEFRNNLASKYFKLNLKLLNNLSQIYSLDS